MRTEDKNNKNSGMMLGEKILLTVNEVNAITGIGTNQIYSLINTKKLPALKLGGLKVRRSDLVNFINNYGTI